MKKKLIKIKRSYLQAKYIERKSSIKISRELLFLKRYEDRERKRQQRHCSTHCNGNHVIVKNWNKPHRHQKVYENSISPDFVEEILERLQKKEDKKNLQNIMSALSELPKKQQRRFLLHHYHGLSIQQIADFEHVHYMTVNESVQRATRSIKDKLKTNNV